MSNDKNLQVGDVFEIKAGMRISANIPAMFVYSNRPKSEELAKGTFEVGEVLDNGGRKKLKTKPYAGHYVVVDTKFDGGTTGHDAYPDAHHVFAQMLSVDGQYDPKGVCIEFYQSRLYTPNISPADAPVIRTMKKVVNFV